MVVGKVKLAHEILTGVDVTGVGGVGGEKNMSNGTMLPIHVYLVFLVKFFCLLLRS